MRIMNFVRALLAVATMLVGATSVHAQAVPGQGTWETTLLGRDINLNAVAATSTSAVYLYDTTLNVTWLRNANVSAGNGNGGLMDWATANNWADTLVTGSGATAISTWRLPTVNFAGCIASNCGWNAATSSSEMASLFFSTLGNRSEFDINGNSQAGFGLTNVGSFQNLQSYVYWSGTEQAFDANSAWLFSFNIGFQTADPKSWQLNAMAVHSGDVGSPVSPVPEPETYAMLLAGLGLIGVIGRRRRRT